MPQRQKTEDQEVIDLKTVKVGGKWVQKKISTIQKIGVTEDVDLYDEDGEVIGTHRIPVMESYEE